jgi:hypothetical protein
MFGQGNCPTEQRIFQSRDVHRKPGEQHKTDRFCALREQVAPFWSYILSKTFAEAGTEHKGKVCPG